MTLTRRFRLRRWLLLRLAGQRVVIINANIALAAPILVKPGDVVTANTFDPRGIK